MEFFVYFRKILNKIYLDFHSAKSNIILFNITTINVNKLSTFMKIHL